MQESKKYGLNLSTTYCFFCGQPKGWLAVGRLDEKDSKSVDRLIDSYDPCYRCQSQWNKGVALLTVVESVPNDAMPAIQALPNGHGLYPTGSWAVVSEEFAYDYFEGQDFKRGDAILVSKQIFKEVLDILKK